MLFNYRQMGKGCQVILTEKGNDFLHVPGGETTSRRTYTRMAEFLKKAAGQERPAAREPSYNGLNRLLGKLFLL